jgi:hypothetical protein
MKSKLLVAILTAIGLTLVCYSQTSKKSTELLRSDDDLKIEFISPINGSVIIGGKILKKGDVFKANQKIDWAKHNTKALKVRNERTGGRIRFCAKGFKARNVEEVKSWFIKYNKTHYKGTESAAAAMDSILSQTHYLVDDTLCVNSRLPQNLNTNYYIARVLSSAKTIKFVLPFDDETNEIVLTKAYLNQCGVDTSNGPIQLQIEYNNNNEMIAITDRMLIEYIPNE